MSRKTRNVIAAVLSKTQDAALLDGIINFIKFAISKLSQSFFC